MARASNEPNPVPIKSNKWCLHRLRYDGADNRFFLNVGTETTIGRNKNADITSISNICSRNHCSILLQSDDNITIRNLSTNGTYVNRDKIETETRLLKHNDTIGLGCDLSIFNLSSEEDWKNYCVYQLIDLTMVNATNDVIYEISDDEDDIKPIIKNDDVIDLDDCINDDQQQPIISINDEDDHDDNELIYSQQILLEIKKEVNCSDTNECDDDFSIPIEVFNCDDVDEENSWKTKLSQDQDLVVKKVIEAQQNNKRKLTKQIEAIPIIPAKRCRVNSMPAHAKRILVSVEKQPRANDDCAVSIKSRKKASDSVKSNTLHDTSASSVDATKSKKIEKNRHPTHFIDRFDPFVSKPKTNNNKISFESALKKAEHVTKKKRVAHQPKKKLLSILRQKNGGWPSDKIKTGHKIQFSSDKPTVHEYTPDRDDIGEIIPSPIKPIKSHSSDALSSFQNDPLHNIITDITEWKTEWLTQRNSTPPLNGVNFVLSPLVHSYPSFDEYKNTLTPLLKHELWSSIQAENRNRNRFEVKINEMNIVKRADRNRIVFHVEVVGDGANALSSTGDFVIVEASNSINFFAYVTNHRFIPSGYSKTTFFTMEASEAMVNLKHGESSTLYLTPIANIRTELKLFNAVFYLDRTPFKNLVLNPESYKEPNIPNRISSFHYSGYDKLNEEQMQILKSVYNKCLSSDPTLSLIEGPPGTGKTRLIVSIILQLLFGHEMKRKLRILVLTASNAAVDIIAKKLMHIREKLEKIEKRKFLNVVRYGVVNSMHPDVRKIAPQNLKNSQSISPPSQSDPEIRKLLDERKMLENKIETLKISTLVVDKEMARDNQKRLTVIKETLAKKLNPSSVESDAIRDVMIDARVVCSTLSSCINLKQYIAKFDVCFIDEASQCTEPWTLVPLQYNVTSLILVGDSNQLNPVVLSNVCRNNSLDRSLFSRLYDSISQYNSKAKSAYAMTTQYRMHPEICSFPNSFYRNRLCSAENTMESFYLQPYTVFNLNCLQSNNDMVNYYNSEEAKFIVSMLKVMVKHANPKEFSYGIITPYAKQRSELQNQLSKSLTLNGFNIPVNTIDSYQGQERDIIILCTTRTNGIGFLANLQRLNVALTRAKKCLVICGNFTSISKSTVWERLIEDAKQRGKYHDIPKNYVFQTIADSLVNKSKTTRKTP